VLLLTEDGRFVDVAEVKVNTDFLDYKQKLTGPISHYVADVYED
jgi:hypothetical protein